MTNPFQRDRKQLAETLFAVFAVAAGLFVFAVGSIVGHHAGWHRMVVFSAPSTLCLMVALATRRRRAILGAAGGFLFAGLGFSMGA